MGKETQEFVKLGVNISNGGKHLGGKRKRRGIFNFVGELSKILFGTMGDDDAKYYNEQIELFEQGSEDMTALTKEQLSVVKSALGSNKQYSGRHGVQRGIDERWN
jgi:hypothetical protein